jgi:hypothetical protein
VAGFDLPQVLMELAGPVELDLDGRHLIGLKVLHDLRRKLLRVEEFIALVPLDLGLLPPRLEMLGLKGCDASLASINKAERGAEGRGGPGKLRTSRRVMVIGFSFFSMGSC